MTRHQNRNRYAGLPASAKAAAEKVARAQEAWGRMHRYIVLVHVRPEGRPGAAFDPSTITVTARDDQAALDVAVAVALERGWETSTASIIRKEPVQ